MPERTDKYEDLIPHHRRVVDENFINAEKAFEEYMELAGHNISTFTRKSSRYFLHKELELTGKLNPEIQALKNAYISGWNQHRYETEK